VWRANPHTIGNSYGYLDTYAHRHSDGNTNRDTYCYSNSYASEHTNAYDDADTNRYTRYDSDSDSNAYCHRKTVSDTQAAPDSASAANPAKVIVAKIMSRQSDLQYLSGQSCKRRGSRQVQVEPTRTEI
jgi:hypothetical protein